MIAANAVETEVAAYLADNDHSLITTSRPILQWRQYLYIATPPPRLLRQLNDISIGGQIETVHVATTFQTNALLLLKVNADNNTYTSC